MIGTNALSWNVLTTQYCQPWRWITNLVHALPMLSFVGVYKQLNCEKSHLYVAFMNTYICMTYANRLFKTVHLYLVLVILHWHLIIGYLSWWCDMLVVPKYEYIGGIDKLNCLVVFVFWLEHALRMCTKTNSKIFYCKYLIVHSFPK